MHLNSRIEKRLLLSAKAWKVDGRWIGSLECKIRHLWIIKARRMPHHSSEHLWDILLLKTYNQRAHLLGRGIKDTRRPDATVVSSRRPVGTVWPLRSTAEPTSATATGLPTCVVNDEYPAVQTNSFGADKAWKAPLAWSCHQPWPWTLPASVGRWMAAQEKTIRSI